MEVGASEGCPVACAVAGGVAVGGTRVAVAAAMVGVGIKVEVGAGGVGLAQPMRKIIAVVTAIRNRGKAIEACMFRTQRQLGIE